MIFNVTYCIYNHSLYNIYFFRFSPPPGGSSGQQKFDTERFRGQPGRIEDYSLGRGSLAQKDAQQVRNFS